MRFGSALRGVAPILLLLPVLVSGRASPSFELYDYDPVANPKAVVNAGNARFTVLTPQLIRMEYDKDGKFEDRATLAFVNRNVPVPQFSVSKTATELAIQAVTNTSVDKETVLDLTYKIGSEFTADSLSVTITYKTGRTMRQTTWTPGSPNWGNLLGTIKSLDEVGTEKNSVATTLNCTQIGTLQVHGESLHCQWGLVSRDGWSVVDDSDNWGLTAGAEWWDSPNTDTSDLYLFAHGHDYKQAIADYTLVGGKVPVVPRYSLGVWFTRWFDFNNMDVKRLVNKYREYSLPLDVYVTDMNWHKKDNWGGFTFDPNLYPYPENTFGWLHKLGLMTAANLHDANGIGSYEKMYPEMCKAMGLDPSTGKAVPFSIVNKTYVYALEDIVLGDVADKLDFWWIDWQQGGTQGGAAGGKQNPTIWTNKIRVTDPKRQGKTNRAIVLARWGGLGTHRYPVGFSGDVSGLTWPNLAYQPWFSMTSANVGYGFWSHDIEGPSTNPEMYVRWVQWAAYSGILRSHDRGMSGGGCAGHVADESANTCSVVRPWEVQERYFDPIRRAMVTRSEMVPYLYNAARNAFETGLGLLWPMYYEYPENEMAYAGKPSGEFTQYFFGSSDIFVSPIVSPVSNDTNMATKAIWIPPGSWVEKDTGYLHQGGDNGFVLNKSFDLTEIPVFIKAGAVIPGSILPIGDTIGKAKQQASLYVFSIYPGSKSGSGILYEDDGITSDYLSKNSSAFTSLEYSRTDQQITITIDTTAEQSYNMRESRAYQINIVNGISPSSVMLDAQTSLPYDDWTVSTGGSTPPGWFYSGPDLTLSVRTGDVESAKKHTVVISFPSIPDEKLSGLKGGLQKANLAKDTLDVTRSTPGAHNIQGGNLSITSSVGEYLTHVAHTDQNLFIDLVSNFSTQFQWAVDEIGAMKPNANGNRVKYAQTLLANAFN